MVVPVSETKLRRLIAERGIKPTWIAQQMGVDPSAVTYWCKRGVPPGRVKALAALLHVRQKDLRDG